ncbi:MAG: hypothetical protein WC679_01575 [Bacteroidales bacterium]|jgi:hypothetical protein
MNPIVWLDLEDTIIPSWADFLYSGSTKNIKEVRTWLRARDITQVNIFSAAIWDRGDKTIFLEQMKTELEDLLKVDICQWPSIEDLMKASKKFDFAQYYDTTEFVQLNGKFISFLKYCMVNGRNQHNILIDDSVADWVMIGDSGKTTIETINILTVTGKKW